MSSYLLINSNYRDRLLYPNQADFIVPFQTIHSLETALNVLNTFNPITVYPIYSFGWTNYDSSSTDPSRYTTTITGGSQTNIQLSNDIFSELFGIQYSSLTYLHQSITQLVNILQNYYVEVNGQTSLILSYSPTYNTITIADNLSFTVGQSISILNQVSIVDPALSPRSAIFLNGSLSPSTYQNQLVLYNINLNERRLGQFNSTLNLFETEEPFSATIQPTDRYLLYTSTVPFLIGQLELFPLLPSYYIDQSLGDYQWMERGEGYSASQTVFITDHPQDEEYIPNYHSLFKISSITREGGIQSMDWVDVGPQSFSNTKTYFIKCTTTTVSIRRFATIRVNTTRTVFLYHIQQPQPFHYHPRDFIGQYFQCLLLSPLYEVYQEQLYVSPNVRIPVTVDTNVPNDLYHIQVKNGVFGITNVRFLSSDKVYLFTEKIPSELLRRFDLYLQYTQTHPALPIAYEGCLHTQIYPFLREGIVPLNFTGTYLTQSTMSCYELNVSSLVLPNVPIVSLNSFLTSGFPFVLLEISNVSMPNSHTKNSIISNNPHTVNTTFICPISDISSPEVSKYIKINSAGMRQIIKFTPADNLRFRILLPNGELFQTQVRDFAPPAEPNPLLQLGLVLELRKLS